ncbi:MAG: DUF2442 domain-containing protein [Candidatus Eisenbacteria bacterium]
MERIPSVTSADYRGDYRIHLAFDDGTEKTVDFRVWLKGPIFVPLLDPSEFSRFRIEGGSIAWENGADIAPETLRAAPSDEEAA